MLSEEFKKGNVSIWLALLSMAIAAVPSHGYTLIAFIVFLLVCGAIWFIRKVSKSATMDQHYAWYTLSAVLIAEIQQQWPPNGFMFWHTVILSIALIAMHFVAKAEPSSTASAT